MTRQLLLSVGAVVLLGAGCTKATPTNADSAQLKTLAMLRVSGDSNLATLIRAAQQQVERDGQLDAYLRLGQLWVRQARFTNDPGYYLSAEACAALGLALAPSNARALALKAMVAANQHRFTEAKTIALQALAKDADDLLALSTLADANFELGAVEQSVEAVQHMVDLKPNLPSYGRAAHLRWLKGDLAGAKQLVRLAIDSGRDTRDPEPWAYTLVQAAGYFWAEGDLDGAEAGFRQALAVAPHFPPALVGQGRVALARGNAAQAVASLAEALEKAPAVETAWLLADAYELMGDVTQALALRDRVHQLGATTDHLTLGLYEATNAEHPERALELLAAEVKGRPNVYVVDAWAWALYRAGRLDEAQAASDRARAQHTPEPRFIFHAGAIAMARGDRDAGAVLLKKALALNPAFDVAGAREARHLLLGSAHAAK